MDNPETPVTLGTQDIRQIKHNTTQKIKKWATRSPPQQNGGIPGSHERQ